MFLTDVEATLEAIRCQRAALESDVVFMRQFNDDREAVNAAQAADLERRLLTLKGRE